MHPDVTIQLAEQRRHSLLADAASVRTGRRHRRARRGEARARRRTSPEPA
ncbi:MAG TPA: hypothetical protein VFP06_05880 [Acidimicrobiales bacterium]|nr:hypothetical protein [Acidimicrobiales bacterium]